MKKTIFFLLFSTLFFGQNFTKTDTLKGSDTNFRNFWNVLRYEITVEPDFETKSVKGNCIIYYEITKDVEKPTFQIDLQKNMNFEVLGNHHQDEIRREGDFIFIDSYKSYKKGSRLKFKINFTGNPIIAKNAPWDGGWVFAKDKNGNPFISVAQEGLGVSNWLPCKDIWSDEPDFGMKMSIITPKNLVGVGNGRLISTENSGDKKIWTWEVKNPINPYSIVPTVGKFVNFKDKFQGEKGNLDLYYWVLDYNREKAKKQFTQVKPMLKAFEHWFGPYPFYEDSYKIVETPYLGMEHQSAVAYGNNYENGYLGKDWSGTGVGLKWDFIIVHESGHEWFANNITAKDQADMWIHEAFTCYSETLFVEDVFGKEDAQKYILGIRKNIRNDSPIIGKYGVKNEGSSDMYWKGAAMIHTIRTVIGDDEKFRQILRGLNRDFYHQTVTTKQIEDYISAKSGIDFSSVFDQYLRTTMIPKLRYYQYEAYFNCIFDNTIKNFKLPLKLNNGKTIIATTTLKGLDDGSSVLLNPNYFIEFAPFTKHLE